MIVMNSVFRPLIGRWNVPFFKRLAQSDVKPPKTLITGETRPAPPDDGAALLVYLRVTSLL